MRVLMVADGYPPDLGGLENHVYNLVEFLHSKGVHVVVLTRMNESTPSACRYGSVLVLRWLKISRPLHASSMLKASLSLAYALRALSSRFDVVHYHGMFTEAFVLLRGSMPASFLTLHGYFLSCPKYTLIDWLGRVCHKTDSVLRCTRCILSGRGKLGIGGGLVALIIAMYKKLKHAGTISFTRVFAVSQSVAYNAIHFLKRSQLRVLYNFVGTSMDDPSSSLPEETLSELKSKFVVLYAGRLSAEKGVATLLRAWSMFTRFAENAVLIVTGLGPLHEIVSSQSRNSHSSIRYLGYISHDDLMKWMRRADLFVLPSAWPDPCPTSILEAIRNGATVAASDTGGIPEILGYHDGHHLFEPMSGKSLLECLRRCYSNGGQVKQNRVLNAAFTVEFVGNEILKEYMRAVNVRRPRQ